jgi:hypothetical protein
MMPNGEGTPVENPPGQQPVPLDIDLENLRSEVHAKLGYYLSVGREQSVQKRVYDHAWALVNGASASAAELLEINQSNLF